MPRHPFSDFHKASNAFVFFIFIPLSWEAVVKTELNTGMFIKYLFQLYIIRKQIFLHYAQFF